MSKLLDTKIEGWVVAEDTTPKLFECDYINEPHEERDPIIPTVIMLGDEVIGYSKAKMSDVVGGLRLNQDYLQRNAEANRTVRYESGYSVEYPANEWHIVEMPPDYIRGMQRVTAQCTPSRNALTRQEIRRIKNDLWVEPIVMYADETDTPELAKEAVKNKLL